MKGTLLFLRALLATNFKASLALRGAFWLQVGFMALNNLIFFVMWWVFFERFEEVRGWRIADMAAIYGICAGAFGFSVVVGGGARDLARLIAEGDLDSVLAQPKSPLLQAVAARSQASGWGDMLSAIVLLGLSGYVTPAVVPLALLACLCGGVVFIATTVLIQSLAFWLGDMRSFARQVSDFLVIFSVYPKTIFTGAMKFLLYTAIPAGFISFLPVELVRGFTWPVLGAVLGGAVLYAALACRVFAAGLRRYESGSRFAVRA